MKKKRLIPYPEKRRWFSKILWRMKLIAWCMLMGILSVSAKVYSQEELISLRMEQVSLMEIFRQITRETGYDFLYNYDLMAEKGVRDVRVSDVKLKDFLYDFLRTEKLEYEFRDRVIIVRKAAPLPEGQQQVTRQEIILRGKVVDQSGTPLPGVSVFVENTSIGVATNITGEYALPLVMGEKVTLIYSFIGMKREVYAFDGKTVSHNVVLVPEDEILEDVVVIGYGSKSKHDLTSAVSTLDAAELVQSAGKSANTFDNMLGGAIKGVMVTQNSGAPGASATVNIRGITSPLTMTASANEPLYVIDGVPFFNNKSMINPLSAIAANDIESIDVLKDASATAIYGSRGANGVIIVKTKTGRKNEKMTVDAGYTFSVGNPVKAYDPLNATEFRQWHELMLKNAVAAYNAGNYMIDPTGYAIARLGYQPDGTFRFLGLNEKAFGTGNTDWVKEVKNRNAQSHQYNIGLRGGNEMTNYAFSFNGTNQEGLFVNDKLDRYGMRLSLDSDLSDRWKAGASVSVTYSVHTQGNQEGEAPQNIRPDVDARDGNGKLNRLDATYIGTPGAWFASPLARYLLVDDEAKAWQFMGGAFLEFEILRNLTVRGDINLGWFQDRNEMFSPQDASDDYSQVMEESFANPLLAMRSDSENRMTNSSLNFRADYKLSLGNHKLNAMLGYGWDRTFTESFSAFYEGFPDNSVVTNAGSAYTILENNSGKGESGLNSVYARLGYIYADRYLAEVNFRSDVSSKFGPGNRRGYFPSLSVGWRMSEERFLENAGFLDHLKLRLSWGQTGSTNVDDFSYKQFFGRGNRDYWGGLPSISLKDALPNEAVRWEMTTEYNGGVDFAFWQHRLYGSVDVYYRKTDGALAPTPPPLGSGFQNYTSNLIDLSNQGLEIEIGGDIIRRKDWKWNSRLNIACNRNRIEKLNGAALDALQMEYYMEGETPGILKGYVVEKIFQDQNEVNLANADAIAAGHVYYYQACTGPGDYKFKDIDGDGAVTEKDRTVIASPEPDFFGGFFNAVSWKNLNLSFMFQFSHGAEALAESFYSESSGRILYNVSREIFGNTWTPENPGARYARILPEDVNQNVPVARYSDRYVYSTSYLRLKNVTLSYTLPAEWLRKANIQQLQLYASMSNLWTLTDWPGIDPELVAGGNITMGSGGNVVNRDPYPLSRTISLGVQIQF